MKEDDVRILVQYRLQQAESSLEDAKFLFEGQRNPRSIVNRSYYAMFYAALALLQKVGKVPRKHTGAISLFDTEFVLKGIFPKELSKNFHDLFDLRQESDYQITESPTLAMAETVLKKADIFVHAINDYLQPGKAGVPPASET
ncbi:MAG: HEPN domain-containing protein [Candidatus Omnitrophota bacterium]